MFDEAERRRFNPKLVRTNRGVAFLAAGRFPEALPLLEEAARANPKLIADQCNLCLVLAELGRTDDASIMLDRIEELRRQQAMILTTTPLARDQIDQTIQNCRDRLAGKPKPDLAALDEL